MSQTKLIRHNMGSVAPPPPGTTQEKITDRALIKALLIAKLAEEGQEIALATTKEELLAELGDAYEIIHSLALMHGFTIPQVYAAASNKADARGPLLVSMGTYDNVVAVLHRVEMPR